MTQRSHRAVGRRSPCPVPRDHRWTVEVRSPRHPSRPTPSGQAPSELSCVSDPVSRETWPIRQGRASRRFHVKHPTREASVHRSGKSRAQVRLHGRGHPTRRRTHLSRFRAADRQHPPPERGLHNPGLHNSGPRPGWWVPPSSPSPRRGFETPGDDDPRVRKAASLQTDGLTTASCSPSPRAEPSEPQTGAHSSDPP